MAHTDKPQMASATLRIPVIAFGFSVSAFCAITYSLCVLFYILFPGSAEKHVLLSFYTPWFEVLNWSGFFLGLLGSIVCGWYIALVFGPIYNFFAAWRRR